jgi:hypothetical protein
MRGTTNHALPRNRRSNAQDPRETLPFRAGKGHRWFALLMRLIEGLGLSNYVLEEFERKPRW